MSVLVLAEHDNESVKPATHSAITAASELDFVVIVGPLPCNGSNDVSAAINQLEFSNFS